MIRNEWIKGNIDVTLTVDKIIENKIKQFGHVMKKKEHTVARVLI